MKRVLIIRSGAVGDLVLTLPVLAALKKCCDGISIDMMGDPVRLALLKQCGYVDKVQSIDDRDFTPLFVRHASLADGLALRNLQSYDAIISYLPDSDGVFAENLRRIAAGPVVSGLAHPDGDDAARRMHMTHVLMKALISLGVDPVAEAPELRLPLQIAKADSHRESSDKSVIAVHPGSGGLAKCWPAERYVSLIECLVDRGYRPVVTFGPADDTVRRRILPRIKSREALIVDDRPLVDMAILYARCQAMIGNDSGMTHLAAAAGTPVIALFGPTDPAVWGPRGKQVRLLWGRSEIGIDVGSLTWKVPFRPRSLAEIDAETPIRTLLNLGVAADTAV